MTHSENHIENPSAYNAAVKERIKTNAAKGKRARWLIEVPDRAALVAMLAANAGRQNFLGKLNHSYEEYGSLTERQEAAVRKMMAGAAERATVARTADAASIHVGEVAVRQVFTLTLRSTFSYESDYGEVHGHVMVDGAGNVVIYKGQRLGRETSQGDARTFVPLARGETFSMKATVKRHEERQGVKQTIVNRPKLEAPT